MKKEDQLLDELLKEHAKHGRGNDEAFLSELEERLQAGEVVAEEEPKRLSAGARWAMGAGVAACLAVGVVVMYEPVDVSVARPPEIVSYGPSIEDQSVGYDSRMRPYDFQQSDSEFGATSPSLGVESEFEVKEAVKPSNAPNVAMSKVIAGGANAKVPQTYPEFAGNISNLEIGSVDVLAEADSFGDSSWSATASTPRRSKKGGVTFYGQRQEPVVPHCPTYPGQGQVQPTSAERYGDLVDNPWKAPLDARSSLSTFAVDVDTASYANIRRMLRQGQSVPANAVRIEEMINYFDYRYAQPEGKHPFAVQVDAMAAPWEPAHRLVRVGIQGKEIVRQERPAANLVFLLDVSGSMSSDDKLPLLKKSMQYLLEELNEKDSVSIVVYAGASGLVLPATAMDDAGRLKVLEKMDALSAGGSTAGGEGIKLAYKVAQEQFKDDGINRIILATDGDFNVGVSDTEALTKMVKQKAKSGTYLSVLGFGQGNINDAMLESITNSGNGNYSYIDSIKEGRKVLLEDMMGTMVTIAKDVKVQVQMNPSKVKAYRLIGYANRMLPAEAFLDKKVDAGEIGAGHSVTALYEIIPADGKPFGAEVDGSRYFEQEVKEPAQKWKDSDELCFVKLAYKEPEQKVEDESTYFSVPFVDKESASADQSFAAAVALFGMELRESEFKGDGGLELVLKLAKQGKGTDGKGQRAEFIQMVERYQAREQ